MTTTTTKTTKTTKTTTTALPPISRPAERLEALRGRLISTPRGPSTGIDLGHGRQVLTEVVSVRQTDGELVTGRDARHGRTVPLARHIEFLRRKIAAEKKQAAAGRRGQQVTRRRPGKTARRREAAAAARREAEAKAEAKAAAARREAAEQAAREAGWNSAAEQAEWEVLLTEEQAA